MGNQSKRSLISLHQCPDLILKLRNPVLSSSQLFCQCDPAESSCLQPSEVGVELAVCVLQLLLQLVQLCAKDRLVRVTDSGL
jgi:hypothetical protein